MYPEAYWNQMPFVQEQGNSNKLGNFKTVDVTAF